MITFTTEEKAFDTIEILENALMLACKKLAKTSNFNANQLFNILLKKGENRLDK